MARPDREKDRRACCGIDSSAPTEQETHLARAHARRGRRRRGTA